jgi:hypothetical protein
MPSKQATKNDDKVFTEAERAAVAATARERKAASGRSPAEERPGSPRQDAGRRSRDG